MSDKHQPSRDLLDLALDAGWSAIYQYGADIGDCPYISVDARQADRRVTVTWHTRDTGTYRVFSVLYGTTSNLRSNGTLKAARGFLLKGETP